MSSRPPPSSASASGNASANTPAVAPTDATDLTALLGQDAHRPRWRRISTWLVVAAMAALAAGWWAWRGQQRAEAAPRYVTTPLARGTLAITVTATGTLQPTLSVNVGSELSGTVARVLVDVNDKVKRGQLLVELDTAKLRDAVTSARGALASAQAQVRVSEATVRETTASLARLEEVARLSGGKVPSQAELDTARATLARAQATDQSNRADVAQAQASLSTTETNLAKAAIRSPIDGVVLTRSVDPGNAVAASLQAVTLFTLAEDLAKMKLSVNVDEADVGQVRDGQSARFTVAAQPGREYPATITRVAYGSKTTDNVVTYTTELAVNNADLSLRPGMTATATIAATQRENVLLVPNAALRYTPSGGAGQVGAGAAAGGAGSGTSGAGGSSSSGSTGAAPPSGGGGLMSKLMPRPPGLGGGARRAGTTPRGSQRQLWVLENGQPVAYTVNAGLSDGKQTEVTGNGLREGMAVITDQRVGSKP